MTRYIFYIVRISSFHPLLFLILFTPELSGQATHIWNREDIAYNPESIVYDKTHDCCYVSNFGANPSNGMNYNQDYVTKFSLMGEVFEKKMVPNLTAPAGLCINNGNLYIVESFGIVKFDLKKSRGLLSQH